MSEPFQCYFSTNPSYDYNERVFDFVSRILKSRYHAMIMFDQFSQLFGNLAYIGERINWSAPKTHTVEFQSFDLIKAVTELELGFETLERLLLKNSDTPQFKLLLQYSSDGFNNLTYGEEL